MSQYNVAEDVSSAVSHESAAAYVLSRPVPDYVCYMCAQSGAACLEAVPMAEYVCLCRASC